MRDQLNKTVNEMYELLIQGECTVYEAFKVLDKVRDKVFEVTYVK